MVLGFDVDGLGLTFYFSQCQYASAPPFLQQIKWLQQQNISNRIITINNMIIAMEIGELLQINWHQKLFQNPFLGCPCKYGWKKKLICYRIL